MSLILLAARRWSSVAVNNSHWSVIKVMEQSQLPWQHEHYSRIDIYYSDCGSKATNLMSFSRLTVLWLKSQSVITTQLIFFDYSFFFFWMLGVGRCYWFNAHHQGLRYREHSWSKMAFSKSTSSSPSSLSFSFSVLNSFMRFKCAWWRWGLTLLLLKLSDKSRVGVSCFLTYHLC